ncbi:hypothetical protein BKA81DRAFT_383479 [Phyllosticta paracitricarpa]
MRAPEEADRLPAWEQCDVVGGGGGGGMMDEVAECENSPKVEETVEAVMWKNNAPSQPLLARRRAMPQWKVLTAGVMKHPRGYVPGLSGTSTSGPELREAAGAGPASLSNAATADPNASTPTKGQDDYDGLQMTWRSLPIITCTCQTIRRGPPAEPAITVQPGRSGDMAPHRARSRSEQTTEWSTTCTGYSTSGAAGGRRGGAGMCPNGLGELPHSAAQPGNGWAQE